MAPLAAKRLTEHGYAVVAPHYPNLNLESIATILPKVLPNHTLMRTPCRPATQAGQRSCSRFSSTSTRGWTRPSSSPATHRPNSEDEPVLQDAYDWAAIRANVRDPYLISSREDPYGCDDKQGRAIFERLGGTQIFRDDGHFEDIDQSYGSFELLDRLID
jgi:uncharacterized protein